MTETFSILKGLVARAHCKLGWTFSLFESPHGYQRWMFEMCRRVENHELGEWFRIDDVRPFAPLHGPGEDPYTVHEFRSENDARVLQDGSMGNEKIKVL